MLSKEENILLNAEKLFAEKGFEATSTREISAAANVNVSMISYYFGSKEQLLERIFEYRMTESTQFSEQILENEGLSDWEKLITVVNMYIGRVQKMRDFYSVMHTEQIKNKNPHIKECMKESKAKFLKVYQALLTSGQEKGIFTKNPKVELVYATVVGTISYVSSSMELLQNFRNSEKDPDQFRTVFLDDLKTHLKNVLKDLVGYEQN